MSDDVFLEHGFKKLIEMSRARDGSEEENHQSDSRLKQRSHMQALRSRLKNKVQTMIGKNVINKHNKVVSVITQAITELVP